MRGRETTLASTMKLATHFCFLGEFCMFPCHLLTEVMVNHHLDWKMRANVLTLLKKHLCCEAIIDLSL